MSDITTIPGWESMTGQEIYVFGLSNPSTANPISAAELEEVLRLHRYCMLDPDGKMFGPLADIARSPQTPEPMKSRLIGLLAQIRTPGAAAVKVNDPEYAGFLAGLMAAIPPTPEFLADFYKLGGGRKYPLFASAEAAEAAKAAAIAAAQQATILQATRDKWTAVSAVVADRLHVGTITPEQSAWIDAFPAGGA